MKKLVKIVGFLGIALALFFVVVLVIFYGLIQVGELRRILISEIEKQTRLRVSLGEAELEVGRIVGISFADLGLMAPDSDRPVITAQRTLVRVALAPLLQRKLVFYEIRFYRPIVRVERDAEGKMAVSDLLAYFSMQRRAEGEFTLDWRELKVEKGEVIFTDLPPDPGGGALRLRDLDLHLRRIQARPSPAASASNAITGDEAGAAMEFSLRAAIGGEGSDERARLTSSGRILFPAEGLELRRALWDAETRLEGLPGHVLSAYYTRSPEAKRIQGVFAPSLRWRGSLSRHMQVQGQIDFKQLAFDAPEFFAGVVAPGDGRAELELEWTPEETRVPRLEFRAGEIALSAQGSLRALGEKGPSVEIHLSSPSLPLRVVRKYLPLKLMDSALLDYLAQAVHEGELQVTKAGLSGPLSGVRHLFEPGSENNIWLEAELKGMAGGLPGGRYLPFKGVSGRIVLENGALSYRNFQGMYGLSRLTDIEGVHKGIFSGRRSLELRVRGNVDLSQLREQMKAGLFPAHTTKGVDLFQEFAGTGRLGLLVRTDFAAPLHYEGQLAVENARLRMADVSLTGVRGGLTFSPKEIRGEKVTALLGGSPLSLRVSLSNYRSDKAAFDVTMDSSGAKAGEALRFFLPQMSPQDAGTVRGRLQYRGLLANAGQRSLSGSLELAGVQLPLKLFRQPLKEVRGKVAFDGNSLEFQGMKTQLAGYGLDLSGRWQYGERPQLSFSLNSAEMDLAYLLPQKEAGSDDWYDRLRVRGRISIGKGRLEGFEFSDLSSDLVVENRVWRLDNFSARSLGGMVHGTGVFTDAADGLAFSVEPKIQGVPFQGFLKWFDMGTREITGAIHLTGKLESRGATGAERKRNLTGDFKLEIKDGVVRRLQLLVPILSVMDLTRWFSFQVPDLSQTGVRFRSVTGDFQVRKGVYSTQNLLVDSDDLSITGAGRYDGPGDVIDGVLAFRPFPRIGSVVSYVPLIGPGLAAIKDSVMVASFNVQGPVDNAAITPAPLSTLSEFFFSALKIPQKIITLPGSGKK